MQPPSQTAEFVMLFVMFCYVICYVLFIILVSTVYVVESKY